MSVDSSAMPAPETPASAPPPGERDLERRSHPRYSPDPWLPVVFNSRDAEVQCAAHIVDISEGGLRMVAPPCCPCPLVWGEQFQLTLAYSESARRFGLEGLILNAVVVRVVSDSREYVVQARFRDRTVHDRLKGYLDMFTRQSRKAQAEAEAEAEIPASRDQETVPISDRR